MPTKPDSDDPAHLSYMTEALAEAKKCIPAPSAFSVGCVIVSPESSQILSRGYSRELPGNTHAEANALAKMQTSQEHIRGSDVYTTMEPCSVRLSGLAPCSKALIEAKIGRCFIGVGEPDDFVKCEGATMLVEAGIEVVWVKGLEAECLAVARRKVD